MRKSKARRSDRNLKNTKRRKQKRRNGSSFSFGKLEPRQLFAADIGVGCGLTLQGDNILADTIQVSDHQDVDSQKQIDRIVNGTQTDGYDAVGIVNNGCTGTLIAPNAVLTAAHCVEGGGSHTFEVNGQTYTATKAVIHPDYQGKDVDLAVMILDQNVTGITPYELNRVTPQVGEMLTIVGFGATGDGNTGHNGDFGVKHEGTTPIDKVDDVSIIWNFDNNSESNTAPGDSGGPAFLNHGGKIVLAGVTSSGLKADASIGDTSFDTRVDAFVGWIDSVAGTFDGSTGGGDDGGGDDGGGDDGGGDNGGTETQQTFTSNTPINIPANKVSTVNSTVNATGMSGAIVDVDVKLNISHTWNEDLNVTLISPSGTRIPLFEAVGQDGDNFSGTVLDQQATTNIEDGDAPFAGRFVPTGDLTNLNGEDANGVWTLEVEDTFPEDGGRINSFAVTLTTDGGSTDSGGGDELSELAKQVDGEYELAFFGDYFENIAGQSEKWMPGNNGWFYILPDGSLMQHEFEVAQFNADYYADPSLLHTAGDADLAAKLDVELGLEQIGGSYFEDIAGLGEKWMKGNNGWYYILPNGQLKQQGQLVAHFDVAYYNDPALLHEASTRSFRVAAASAQSMIDNAFEDDDSEWWNG